MLKKNIAKLLVFAMILSMLPFSAVTAGAAGGSTEAVYSITLDASAKSLKVNEEYTLKADVSYKVNNDIYKVSDSSAVVWTSSDANIASVTGGKVKGVNIGTATITASYTPTDKNSVTATCTITVTGGTTSKPTYTIEMDTTTKSLKVDESYRLDADVMYKIGTDTHKVTSPEIKWTSSKTNVASISGNTLTAQAAGETTITASYTPPGETKAVTETRVVKVTADNDEGYTIKFDSAPDYGTVKVQAEGVTEDIVSESTKVGVGKKVTITAKANKPDEYKLNLDTFGVYKVDGDTQAATYTSTGSDVYTFVMPGEKVTIKAEFKPISTAKKIEQVDVEMKPITGVKTGYALPKPTTKSEGVKEVQVEWFFGNEPVTNGVFDKIGTYTYQFTTVAKDNYTVDNDTVKYTLNGMDSSRTGNVEVTEARQLSAAYATDDTSPAEGYLTINGTSAAKYYLITEEKTDDISGASASAYLIVKGGSEGTVRVPCEPAVKLNIKEMDGQDKAAAEVGFLFVDGQDAVTGGLDTVKEPPKGYDFDSTPTEPEEPDEGGATPGKLSASYATDETSPAEGYLTIKGTTTGKFYMVTEEKTDDISGASASAYLILPSSGNGMISVPCEPAVKLNIKEMDGEDKAAAEKGYLFVDGQDAVTGNLDIKERS